MEKLESDTDEQFKKKYKSEPSSPNTKSEFKLYLEQEKIENKRTCSNCKV